MRRILEMWKKPKPYHAFPLRLNNLETQSIMKTILVLMSGDAQQSLQPYPFQICFISDQLYHEARKPSPTSLGMQSSDLA